MITLDGRMYTGLTEELLLLMIAGKEGTRAEITLLMNSNEDTMASIYKSLELRKLIVNCRDPSASYHHPAYYKIRKDLLSSTAKPHVSAKTIADGKWI